jgi:hypothetical protein
VFTLAVPVALLLPVVVVVAKSGVGKASAKTDGLFIAAAVKLKRKFVDPKLKLEEVLVFGLISVELPTTLITTLNLGVPDTSITSALVNLQPAVAAPGVCALTIAPKSIQKENKKFFILKSFKN